MVDPPVWPTQPPAHPPTMNAQPPTIGAQPPAPPPPPPLGSRSGTAQSLRVRPWWGMGDIFLGIPFIVALSIAGAVVGMIVSAATGDGLSLGLDGDDNTFGDLADPALTPPALLVLSALAQQLGQAVWPWVVTKWKGISMAVDWRLLFKPIDLVIGLVVGVVGVVLATLIATGVEALIDLDDPSEAQNTDILTNLEGTPWLWAILVVVIVGAPVSEELFFRGLVLRSIEKRWGPVVGVIGSTILFVLVHFTGAGLGATVVLFSSIGLIGLLLGIVAWKTDRIAPAIIAHMVFNIVGSIGALAA